LTQATKTRQMQCAGTPAPEPLAVRVYVLPTSSGGGGGSSIGGSETQQLLQLIDAGERFAPTSIFLGPTWQS